MLCPLSYAGTMQHRRFGWFRRDRWALALAPRAPFQPPDAILKFIGMIPVDSERDEGAGLPVRLLRWKEGRSVGSMVRLPGAFFPGEVSVEAPTGLGWRLSMPPCHYARDGAL